MKTIGIILYIIIDLYITVNLTINLPAYNASIFVGLLMNSLIIPILFYIKKISIYEPVFWFSAYYYLLIVSAYIVLSDNFQNSSLISETSFYNNIYFVFSKTIWIIFIGYLFFIFAYYLVKQKYIIFNTKQKIQYLSVGIIKLAAYSTLLIAIFNFLYNLYILCDLNIINYFVNLAYYSGYMQVYGLTTIGYNFIYVSMFLFTYLYINKNISKYLFFLNVVLYFVLLLSLGRITNTLTSLIVLYLSIIYFKNIYFIDKKLIFKLLIMIILTLMFFFFRMYTSYLRVYGISLEDFINQFSPLLVNILFGEGNLPNIGIVMKIIDSWQNDIGFLFGQSIFVGLAIFLPSSISRDLVINNTVSWLSKKEWYMHLHGGSLPPTIIGDLFANFGIAGVFLGMFLLGIIFSIIYQKVVKNMNFFVFVLYLFFLIKFVFILPKGEFCRFSFILIPVMILSVYYLIYFITNIIIKTRKEEDVETNKKNISNIS